MKYYLYKVTSIYSKPDGSVYTFWAIVDKKIPKKPTRIWSKGPAAYNNHWAEYEGELDAWNGTVRDNRSVKVLQRTLTRKELLVELL